MSGPPAAGGAGVEQDTSNPQKNTLKTAKNRLIPASWWIASGRATCIVPPMREADRLTLLEERYAHLQRHSAEQDKVMLQLADELAKLRKELVALRTQQAGGRDTGEAPDERPPHY